MGKSIDLTQPLSDEDRAWLQERGAYGDIRIADELARVAAGDFAAPQEIPVEVDEDDEVVESDNYGGWTNAQLRYELSTRGLPQHGNKAELVARLEASDEGSVAVVDDSASDEDAEQQ
jgi:hypothetical protein